MKRPISCIVALAIPIILSTNLTYAVKNNYPTKGPPPTINKGAQAPRVEPIDIISATEEQLKSIPGIRGAYSMIIVAGRPYASKDQLKSEKIIPAATYEKIKDRIIAKQPKK